MKKFLIFLLFAVLAHAEVIEITDTKQLQEELQNSDSAVFLDCYSSWCPPCKRLSPLFDEWALKYSNKGKFLKANLDTIPSLPQTYKISSMPTLLIFDSSGELKDRKIGTMEIENYFNNLK